MSSHAVIPPTFDEDDLRLMAIGAEEEIKRERWVDRIVQDMQMMHIPPQILRKIALGEIHPDDPADSLERPGKSASVIWANSEFGQRAAARILAEEGYWDLEIAAKHAKTGYQRFLGSDPVLRNIAVSYKGGALGGLAEKRFDFGGLGNTIHRMTLSDFRGISLSFLEMILPNSEFAKENKMVATISRRKLADRKDLLAKGMNQLDKTRRKLLKKIIEISDQETKDGSRRRG